ncbi:FAD-binding domain-containing protein [Mytilinidion resinicola]|uniref:FAD-binding domain-containing protein n=1 Tax=Mytilinidion resinicola TaxID=574789 RepID=A0A6A6Y8W9_9PEZI|nr:FAD-binding domain-containing protein [Mytilinidion resinicola]KAF2804993.1 FAD-binding domain-containing protein [Mytilinidion resinicola]
MTNHTKTPFRVVIAGGSVAGLSLANMLQANGIDYIILEAYPKIAPQVGASIGLLPHGNRILDQLGLFEKVLSHGYPILFMDRQMVLQVLYDNIKDKSKVLTDKRVTKVEVNEKGVKAITSDGSVYTGDIMIGADGIHSQVRKEMWRIADEKSPGNIPASEHEAVPCTYGCIFGISKPCAGIEPGGLHSIFRVDNSYLVNGGPNGRVYWFYFFKLPKKVYGSDIPRYTKEEEAKLLAARANDNILPNLKFGHLVKEKITTNMTALPEYIFKRWHYDRILNVGDSAHKVHPIAGHGGNGAIETAAVLVNLLVTALKKSTSTGLSTKDVDEIFTKVQDVREKRADTLMEASHEQQRVEGMETPLRKFQALYLLQVAGPEDVMFNFSSNIPFAEKLDMVELPPKPKLIPFKDELASAPKSRGIHGWILMAVYATCGLLAHYGMWIRSAEYGLADQFASIITTGVFPDDPTFPLKRTYTGIGAIDNYLTFLSAAYMPGLAGWDKSFATLQMYFLGMLIQPIAVWTIESCRKRNALTLLSIPTVWLTLVQWAGVGIYMPFYYIAYTWISDREPYWWALSRFVPIHYAKALLPANIIGYVLPTILMFLPWQDPATIQNFEALWQLSPMFVPLLTVLFGAVHSWRYPQKDAHLTPYANEEPADLRDLQRIYAVVGVLGTALHWGILFKLLTSTDAALSISSVFVPDFRAEKKSLGQGIQALFLADFWGFYLASYVWCCSAVWDLKRVGRTVADVGRAAALILLANVVVGPGAAMAGVWYWREGAMARTTVSSGKAYRKMLRIFLLLGAIFRVLD